MNVGIEYDDKIDRKTTSDRILGVLAEEKNIIITAPKVL